MAINTITYDNKVALHQNSEIADINKCNASDMNQIKQVVNENASHIGDLTNLTTSARASLVNSINEVNNKNNYSYTEKKIGKWVDNKIIYRKVIDIGTLPGQTSKSIAHYIDNLDTVVNIVAIGKAFDRQFAIPFPSLASMFGSTTIGIRISDTNIEVVASADTFDEGSGFVILEYTKTTD